MNNCFFRHVLGSGFARLLGSFEQQRIYVLFHDESSVIIGTATGSRYRYLQYMGVSNRWNGIWNGTMEWKMEWNGEHTQLQLAGVTGTAQSRLNYLVYL